MVLLGLPVRWMAWPFTWPLRAIFGRRVRPAPTGLKSPDRLPEVAPIPRKHRLADPLLEPDIIAFDRDDELILAANTKTLRASAAIGAPRILEISGRPRSLRDVRRSRRPPDLSTRFRGPGLPDLRVEDGGSLSFYEPDLDRKRISPDYLEGLIEAWLRDFAFHWKSQRPPASRPDGIDRASGTAGRNMIQTGGALPILLYIETNLILSYATGRDARMDRFLSGSLDPTRLLMPNCCVMEALMALDRCERPVSSSRTP